MPKHFYHHRPDGQPRNELLQDCLAVWRTKRGHRRMPRRADITPRDIKRLLPFVVLANVLEGQNDFEIRLMGESVINVYGENFRGRKLSSLLGSVSDSMIWAYNEVARTGEPVLLDGWFEHRDHDALEREVLLLPLGQTDQRVDHVLSAGAYKDAGSIPLFCAE